jgi:hypothetical protein
MAASREERGELGASMRLSDYQQVARDCPSVGALAPDV